MMQVLNKTGAIFIRLLTTINRNMLIAEKASIDDFIRRNDEKPKELIKK